jgi:ubiquinone/menaquinone biosynthesis C-methylase UbiE
MSESTTRENYVQRGSVAFEQQIAQRTAVEDAAFLLPYLKPGMRVLDVGCGPGSITIGLAGVVAPGEVVGIDIQAATIERASAAAAEAKAQNVHFETGDCYKLPFPDASFDVCFANSVLQHLGDPVAALKEMRRVLRSGGFAGVRDLTLAVAGPANSAYQTAVDLGYRVRRHNGADPQIGLRHRELPLAAGFASSIAGATVVASGSAEETTRDASSILVVLQAWTRTAMGQGWMEQTEVDQLLADVAAWGGSPDAYSVMVRCHAIGWVD